MKKSISILFLFILVSCKTEVKQDDVSKINGYWEIEKVLLSDGSEKEYSINETVDFFEVKANNGYRKKVKPQLDGKFEDTGLFEKITIKFSDKAVINYSTDYNQWDEEIIKLSDTKLVLKNQANIEYHYKRHVPFSVK